MTPESTPNSLNKTLNLPLLTFYGVGMILGAGIYTIVGKAAGVADEGVWISILLAAVSATFTALSYAELGSMYPKVGGEFVYLTKAFPKQDWLARTAGLMMAFSGVATASTVALSFAGYLNQFIEVSPLFVGYTLLFFFTGWSILGLKQSSWMNVVFTLIEVSGLLLLIYYGIKSDKFGDNLTFLVNRSTISASALIIFAYFGFENIVNLAEETKNPEKNLPRAIVLSLFISTVLYLLVSVSAIALMPVEELAQSSAPLTDAVRTLSPRSANILGAIALFATGNTILISLITTSRILFGMARSHALPKALAGLTKKKRTPWIAALLSLGAAAALIPLASVETLAAISSFATMTAFILVNGALIVLRYQQPSYERPFKSPVNFGKIPVLGLLGVLTSILLIIQFDTFVYKVGVGFLVFILFLQFLIKKPKKIL